MVSLRRYYNNPDENSDESENDNGTGVACIGVPEMFEDTEDYEEGLAALQYLASVRNEAKSLPFAIEAVLPTEISSPAQNAPTVAEPTSVTSSEYGATIEVVNEYFQSLRELVNKERGESVSKQVKFVPGMSDSQLACADFASITSAIGNLAEVVDTLPQTVVLEYIWGLLVYLEFPLLEDTSASLQQLRRYCDDRVPSSDPLHSQAMACSVIISHFFHQPA